MSQLNIRFAVTARQADANGFAYCIDIGLLGANEVDSLLSGPLSRILGGFVFIVNGMVWNGYDRPPFDPAHIPLQVDTLAFSALFLDDMASQLDERPTFSCAIAEMVSIQIEFVSSTDVSISGITSEGREIYPPEVVDFGRLLRELVAATDEFVSIAAERVERAADESPDTRRRNREFLERLRRGADRLRQAPRAG